MFSENIKTMFRMCITSGTILICVLNNAYADVHSRDGQYINEHTVRAFVNPMSHVLATRKGNYFVYSEDESAVGFEDPDSITNAMKMLNSIGLYRNLDNHAKRQKGSGGCINISNNNERSKDGKEEKKKQKWTRSMDFLPHAQRFVEHGVPLLGKYINIGSDDGISEDPLYEYVRWTNATGVAIDMDTKSCKEHRRNLPFVELVCAEITPDTVIDHLLHPNNKTQNHMMPFPGLTVDVIKVDIDSFDADVLAAILRFGFRSLAIIVEINPSIPPPYIFAAHYDPELWKSYWQWPFRGMSLSYAVRLVHEFGYDLVSFNEHDAVFVDRRFNFVYDHALPQSEVICYLNAFVSVYGIPLIYLRIP